MIARLALVLGVVAGLAAGCAPGPTRSPAPASTVPVRPEQVVALAGTVGSMRLFAATAAGQLAPDNDDATAGLPLNAAWLSSDRSVLLATTLDGRALTGSPGPPPVWHAGPGDLSGPEPKRAFGSLGPDGRVAFVVGEPGAGTPGRLVIESPAGTVDTAVPLPSAAESAAAWLPDGRIAVIVRGQDDEPETLLVDADRTQRLSGPPLRSVAIGGGLV
ncbi:MAG TPA: hypothetical protein VKR24_12260, partial [Candidatus Limnocylindrales bacterium]|nr:hypothetical protein [Candidatus Limnocylindrales bacterium]